MPEEERFSLGERNREKSMECFGGRNSSVGSLKQDVMLKKFLTGCEGSRVAK